MITPAASLLLGTLLAAAGPGETPAAEGTKGTLVVGVLTIESSYGRDLERPSRGVGLLEKNGLEGSVGVARPGVAFWKPDQNQQAPHTLPVREKSRESDYEQYLREAYRTLEKRQEILQREFKLSTWERYNWNQDTGELIFSQRGVPQVIANIQFVGSYSGRSRTWMWAWANASVDPALKKGVTRVKILGEERGWRPLIDELWAASEEDGWEMTAVTAKVLGALGAYRSPGADGSRTFMVITAIRWAKSDGTLRARAR